MTDLAVIMSVYKNDRLEFLKESIQSILDQTYRNFHYFLIFDGPVSTDIDEYIKSVSDKRLKLFRLYNNEGLAHALNYLLEMVLRNPEYKYIARMDADDISMPSRLETQREFLLENSEISIVGSWYEEVDESGNHLAYRKLPTDHVSLRKRYMTRAPFAHPAVLFRTKLIETAGFYPTDTLLMEDSVLWGKALIKGLLFANIPEFLLKYRIDNEFMDRRSGFNYGWKYIIQRIKIFNSLGFPVYTYSLIFLSGIVKMMPKWFIGYIYKLRHYRFH